MRNVIELVRSEWERVNRLGNRGGEGEFVVAREGRG